MKKFSWFTSKEKYELNGCYVTNKVHHAGTPFEYSECVKHYRPNMKGGHTHHHCFNSKVRKNDRRKIKLKYKKALLVAEFTNIMFQCLGLDPLYDLGPKMINRINQIKKRRSHMACGGKKSGGKKPPKK